MNLVTYLQFISQVHSSPENTFVCYKLDGITSVPGASTQPLGVYLLFSLLSQILAKKHLHLKPLQSLSTMASQLFSWCAVFHLVYYSIFSFFVCDESFSSTQRQSIFNSLKLSSKAQSHDDANYARPAKRLIPLHKPMGGQSSLV